MFSILNNSKFVIYFLNFNFFSFMFVNILIEYINTPTFFFQQVQQFFDCIFNAVRDPKVRLNRSCICILTLWKTEIQIWVDMSRNSDFLHMSKNFVITYLKSVMVLFCKF